MDLLFASAYLLNNKNGDEPEVKKEKTDDDDNDSDKENQEPLTVEVAADAFDRENQMEQEVDWIKLIDEEEEKVKEEAKEEEEEEEEEKPKSCTCSKRATAIPLLDHLCQRYKCSVKELHVLFQALEKRRMIADHLRNNVQLRTTHLVPFTRNFPVRCDELSNLSAHNAPAYRGYLGISVRVHYFVKHGIRLRHPHLPCVVENGGGQHKSFYPLEVLSVVIN